MLVLSRKVDEQIRIGDDIVISILKMKGNTVRVGIEAPRHVRVLRGELPVHEDAAPSETTGGEPVDSESPPPAAPPAKLAATAMQRFIDARCRRDARLAKRCTKVQAALHSTLSG